MIRFGHYELWVVVNSGLICPNRLNCTIFGLSLTYNCAPHSTATPTVTNDPMATEDRLVGPFIVVDPNAERNISLGVTSDPCPTVMWSFQDVQIPDNTTDYTISNPCGSGSVVADATYTFTLTIPSVTGATSGRYTAEFTTEGVATSTLASTYVTIPGKHMDGSTTTITELFI